MELRHELHDRALDGNREEGVSGSVSLSHSEGSAATHALRRTQSPTRARNQLGTVCAQKLDRVAHDLLVARQLFELSNGKPQIQSQLKIGVKRECVPFYDD